jgi:hypothetical protein
VTVHWQVIELDWPNVSLATRSGSPLLGGFLRALHAVRGCCESQPDQGQYHPRLGRLILVQMSRITAIPAFIGYTYRKFSCPAFLVSQMWQKNKHQNSVQGFAQKHNALVTRGHVFLITVPPRILPIEMVSRFLVNSIHAIVTLPRILANRTLVITYAPMQRIPILDPIGQESSRSLSFALVSHQSRSVT